MKIHSLKLTVQDVKTEDAASVAAVMGTVFIEDDQWKKNDEGNLVLDGDGFPIPIYETINFTTALHTDVVFKRCIQKLILEAITLKDMKVAKENGTLSHYLEAMTAPNLKTRAKTKKGSPVTQVKRRKK